MQNSQLKNKKSQKELESSLKEVNLTVDEALSWLNESQQELENKKAGNSSTCSNPYRCFIEGCYCEETENSFLQHSKQTSSNNVTFITGQTTANTAVFVGDVQMQGVVSASLTYDLNQLPVLQIPVMGAKIGS